MSDTRPILLAAAREFNSGRFFEAHEVLEEGLEDIDEPHWDLVLGLIQIAVAYHKASQGLWSGVLVMLEKGLEKTAAFPAITATLQLETLRRRAAADVVHIRAGDFDAVDLAHDPPRLRFTGSP